MPGNHVAAAELASPLDGSSAGELIPELEATAVVGADRHERTEERLGYRNGYKRRSITTQGGISSC